LNYYDIMRQRAQDERARRLQQTSMDVTDGARPVGIMPMNKLGPKLLPQMMGGREVGPKPVAGMAQPVQGAQQFGPPMPAAFQVVGYSKGLKDAGPDAQAYADQFAGGDLSKVKARLINIDGEMKNDYYTRGLLDGPMMPEPGAAPDASTGGSGPPQADWLDRLRMMFNFGGQ
jgi:hypothetical protein